MNLPRVLLADDHTLILEGIRKLLDGIVELVGAVHDGRALLQAVEQTQPEVVLLDISMPLLNGIDAARSLHKLHPEIKLIFLTMHADQDYVMEAVRAGASGYLLKWSAEAELAAAIKTVLSGRLYLTPALPPDVLRQVSGTAVAHSRNTSGLSAREREVLQLVVEGQSAKAAAQVLHLSVKTVEFHKYRMMKKLGLHSTAELAKYAIQRQLLGLGLPSGPQKNPN